MATMTSFLRLHLQLDLANLGALPYHYTFLHARVDTLLFLCYIYLTFNPEGSLSETSTVFMINGLSIYFQSLGAAIALQYFLCQDFQSTF